MALRVDFHRTAFHDVLAHYSSPFNGISLSLLFSRLLLHP